MRVNVYAEEMAVTFWGKRDLRPMLQKAINLLDTFYGEPAHD